MKKVRTLEDICKLGTAEEQGEGKGWSIKNNISGIVNNLKKSLQMVITGVDIQDDLN